MGNGGGCVGRGLVGAGDGKANTFVTSGWEDLGGGGGAGATELRLKKRDDGAVESHLSGDEVPTRQIQSAGDHSTHSIG